MKGLVLYLVRWTRLSNGFGDGKEYRFGLFLCRSWDIAEDLGLLRR